MSSIISQLPSTPMLTQNYTGLACLAVLKLQSGLCQLFGTETKLQTKKITAGSVILIASLLSSIPESSASPDINPWIWKSNSVPEDCQGPRGHRLQRAVAFPSPAWLPKPHGSCSGQQNNGPAPSWRWSSLAVGQGGKRVTWQCRSETPALPRGRWTIRAAAVRAAWARQRSFTTWENLGAFTPACWKRRKSHFCAQGRKDYKLAGETERGGKGGVQKGRLLHRLVARSTDQSPKLHQKALAKLLLPWSLLWILPLFWTCALKVKSSTDSTLLADL